MVSQDRESKLKPHQPLEKNPIYVAYFNFDQM